MKKRSERILKSERGFTLVELGVVLAIMAILALAAYPTYKNIRDRAYEAEAWAIMQEIRVDVWSHYLEDEEWPSEFPAPGVEYDYWDFTGSKKDTNSEKYVITASGKSDTPVEGVRLTLTLKTDGTAAKGNDNLIEST